MAAPLVSPLPTARMKPLVAGIVALLGFSAPAAMAATTWAVTSCDDSAAGSLRAVIGAPTTLSGDTVDISGLVSCVISLHTGAINIPQNSLAIRGSPGGGITVSGKYNGTVEPDRLFKHTGTGTLYFQDLTMIDGDLETTTTIARGGCIYSAGAVALNHVLIGDCTAHSVSSAAGGGAIYGAKGIGLKYSNVSFNTASSTSGQAYGGGAFGAVRVAAKYSTIAHNTATAPSIGFGGGIVSTGSAYLKNSTVSNNYSKFGVGGVALIGSSAGTYLTLKSSTIANNTAGFVVGGILSQAPTVKLYNSTIAFNSAAQGRTGSSLPYDYYAPGLALSASNNAVSVTLQSSMLANNTYGSFSEIDLSTAKTSTNSVTFNAAPAKNLVRVAFVSSLLPADTLNSCPLLGQLRDNGGLTQTVALLSHSIGIDSGNNSQGENEDQRGTGTDAPPYLYPRESNGVADIGAYEVNQADVVFNNNFETCRPLF